MTVPRVVLQPKKARPFFGRHPWVFAGAIDAVDGDPADGDEVDLVTTGGHFVARGLFNSQSKIRVRLYSWEEGRPLDRDFFRDKLANAVSCATTWACTARIAARRLVFSEGDGLSGLTVDRYAG